MGEDTLGQYIAAGAVCGAAVCGAIGFLFSSLPADELAARIITCVALSLIPTTKMAVGVEFVLGIIGGIAAQKRGLLPVVLIVFTFLYTCINFASAWFTHF